MILPEISQRRSVRKYQNRAVEDSMIKEIIEAGCLAPSGSNTQPWHFIVIKGEEMKKKVVAADHDQKWMMQAPILIACVADISCRLKETKGLYLDEKSENEELKLIIRDTAIAIENMLLQAQYLGLATCWTAWFEQKDMKAVLRVPDDKYVCGVVCVGYGDEVPNSRPRRKIEDMIHFEKW